MRAYHIQKASNFPILDCNLTVNMAERITVGSIDYSLYLVTGRDLLPVGKVGFPMAPDS